MRKMHRLKISPEYFGLQLTGKKRFEIRNNDRDFKVDDYLHLCEFKNEIFTGMGLVVRVECICDYNQKRGYVVLGTSEVLRTICNTVLSDE